MNAVVLFSQGGVDGGGRARGRRNVGLGVDRSVVPVDLLNCWFLLVVIGISSFCCSR